MAIIKRAHLVPAHMRRPHIKVHAASKAILIMLKEARHNLMTGRTSSHAAIRVAAISLQGINSTPEIIIAHMHSSSLAAAISSRSREGDIPDNPVPHTAVVDTVAVGEDLAIAVVVAAAADSTVVAAAAVTAAAAADIKTQKEYTIA